MWTFWLAQLAGNEPEPTPGTPHAGFFMKRERKTFYDPIVGVRRKRVETSFVPVAIWQNENGWHCVIGAPPDQKYITDVEAIDNLFSYCCRSAITHEEYTKQVAEKEIAA